MEKLTEELRQKVGKMSDESLNQRLVQASYIEADVARFDRADLLAYYAKVCWRRLPMCRHHSEVMMWMLRRRLERS